MGQVYDTPDMNGGAAESNADKAGYSNSFEPKSSVQHTLNGHNDKQMKSLESIRHGQKNRKVRDNDNESQSSSRVGAVPEDASILDIDDDSLNSMLRSRQHRLEQRDGYFNDTQISDDDNNDDNDNDDDNDALAPIFYDQNNFLSQSPSSSMYSNEDEVSITSADIYRTVVELHEVLYSGGICQQPRDVVESTVDDIYAMNAVVETPLMRVQGNQSIKDHYLVLSRAPGSLWSELVEICDSDQFDGRRVCMLTHILHITLFPWIEKSHGADVSSLHPSHPSYTSLPAHYRKVYENKTGQKPRSQSFNSTIHQSNSKASQGSNGANPPKHGLLYKLFHRHPKQSSKDTHGNSEKQRENDYEKQNILQDNSIADFEDDEDDDGDDYDDTLSRTTEDPGNSTLDTFQNLRKHMGASLAAWETLKTNINPKSILAALTTYDVKVYTHLIFDENARIVHHEDSFGIKELIEGLFPLLSPLYVVGRNIGGVISTITARFLVNHMSNDSDSQSYTHHEKNTNIVANT